jgi:hypothetical protein
MKLVFLSSQIDNFFAKVHFFLSFYFINKKKEKRNFYPLSFYKLLAIAEVYYWLYQSF